MELQYLQKLKELENHFITDNKQAMILSTFDEESICMTLNIFNKFEYIDIQDKDFKSMQNTVINNKLGTALIQLCSCFPSIEQTLNQYINKCLEIKHENSEISATLTIIKPLFSDLGKINICFENIKEIEIENFKKELKDGTPFTLSGAKSMMRLGILTMCIPVVVEILIEITYIIMKNVLTNVGEVNVDMNISFGIGIMFIVTSLICRYGAEQLGNKDTNN